MKKLSINLELIIALVACLNIFGFYRLMLQAESFSGDVGEYQAKFSALEALVEGEGLLGYLADGEKHPRLFNGQLDEQSVDLPSMRRFFICQFALSPHILLHSTKPSKVIVNCSNAASAKKIIEQADLSIIKDLGNGAALCAHKFNSDTKEGGQNK